ncbi:acyl-CoA dehydrogenase family protein [Aureimonas altamirensis]|uniref:acyl-CoA dehydrogenase family protein n=1 Tax=Aureimonas altamirensis TaxID=370622 RepID=UPI00255388F9|nr:acyl-CoA dehydrogenase family protein [Aureimonas altamirensis]
MVRDNQSDIFEDIDFWRSDAGLREAVGDADDASGLAVFGQAMGSPESLQLGRAANEWLPRFRPYDEKGVEIGMVEFHPAYHALMERGCAAGLHSSTHAGGSRVARAARFYMTAQAECGHLCPLTMTHASLAVLDGASAQAGVWRHGILSRDYDPSSRPATEKAGLTIGMGMTERQGGSDIRSNRTLATRGTDGGYRLNGHKWFLSAPMSDAFLMLAGADAGLTVYLVPRILADGTRNGVHLRRLKDKLGNRSNASAEVDLVDATAYPVSEEGAGISTILRMVNLTRLDCALASAGLMRVGLSVALHHADQRKAFGRLLVDQPLMRAILAEIAIMVEASTALVFRLCRAWDRAEADESEAAFARLMTPAAKYWICKLAPTILYEAMECMGGNGYIEDGLLARAYREAPVNAIWEGTSNVIALDVLRARTRSPDAFEHIVDSLRPTAEDGAPMMERWQRLAGGGQEALARTAASDLAILAALKQLRRNPQTVVADAFAMAMSRARQGGLGGYDGSGQALLLERARPVAANTQSP